MNSVPTLYRLLVQASKPWESSPGRSTSTEASGEIDTTSQSGMIPTRLLRRQNTGEFDGEKRGGLTAEFILDQWSQPNLTRQLAFVYPIGYWRKQCASIGVHSYLLLPLVMSDWTPQFANFNSEELCPLDFPARA